MEKLANLFPSFIELDLTSCFWRGAPFLEDKKEFLVASFEGLDWSAA